MPGDVIVIAKTGTTTIAAATTSGDATGTAIVMNAASVAAEIEAMVNPLANRASA